jgi:oligopeptide/dipeptide ABC transporter ATP-binding protein
MAILEVTDLRVSVPGSRGRMPIVDSVSLTIAEGETVGIVGESGSGKSTFALSLMRLLPRGARIDSGSIVFDGLDVTSAGERALRRVRGAQIGLVFQDPIAALNPTRRVGIQIAEVVMQHEGASRRDALRRAEELLESVRISRARARLRAFPHELSGGMCQRVTIAIAMACSPRLLIADEPTTALDPTVEAEVLRLLKDLAADNGMAMILISHDMRVVSVVADRVAVMYAGEFVEQGSARDVLSAPEHPYTEALLRSVPRLGAPDARHQRLPAIAGTLPRVGEWGEGCRFASRCPYFTRSDACATGHPSLREVAGRLVRSAHPRSERLVQGQHTGNGVGER